MRMAAAGSFPLLVEGSWGSQPPKNLSTKLQMYFQSRKRSGGGECEVCQVPGSSNRFLVLFYPDDGERGQGCGGEGKLGSSSRETWGSRARRENPPRLAATVEKPMGCEAQSRRGGLGRRSSACAALPGAAGGAAASACE